MVNLVKDILPVLPSVKFLKRTQTRRRIPTLKRGAKLVWELVGLVGEATGGST
jgi:hypothetical protein